MTIQILQVILFVFSMSITPGPNNLLLTASGALFGFKKTIPHILGIIFGIFCLNLLSMLGLYKVFESFPKLKIYLKIIGLLYMFLLSVKIFRSGKIKEGEIKSKPMSFIQGALFQVLNPKAVLMSITAISVYTTANFIRSSFTICLVFILVGLPSISLWAFLGNTIKKKLQNIRYVKYFNYCMGSLTALAGISLLF